MKTCKLKSFYYVLMPLLCFALVLPKYTILSYASTTSGSETTYYNYTSIYPNNQLNQNVIDKFNEMTPEEKGELLPMLSPLFLKSLGIYTNDAYSQINSLYNSSLASFQSQYPTAQDLRDSNESYSIKKAYTYLSRGHGYYYYEDFNDFLGKNISESEGVLVLDNTETIYDVYNDVIENEMLENGVITADLYSFTHINSSAFGNVSAYSDFMRICREHTSSRFVFIKKTSISQWIYVYIPHDSNVNIYNNGSTLGQTIQVCDNNGTQNITWDVYELRTNATYFGSWGSGITLGSSDFPKNCLIGQSGVSADNVNRVWTLNNNDVTYQLYTSLTGWINSQGHYEPTYSIGDKYGTVPSAVVSSNDMTTYYINNYTDNSVSGSNNVYYPPNYDPTSNGYDSEHKTLSFDGIGNFLASLGELIGSLINGLAQGLANIVNSLISVVNNLKQNLLQGVIFEFLSAFMGWLPAEIVTLLTALFAITVMFALIKLIKGFF